MEITKNIINEQSSPTIELTPNAINKFLLAKESIEDGSKLALRISICSRG